MREHGQLLAEGTSSRCNRVVYSIPASSPAQLQAIAFPGDAVHCDQWSALPNAKGTHPHSGGLLSALCDRFSRLGGVYANAAVFVVEPARLTRSHHALFEHLLTLPLTATGEPAEGYKGCGLCSAHLNALMLSTYAHIEAEHNVALLHAAAKLPLLLLGFSKGGAVCNQLLYELAAIGKRGNRAAPPSSASASQVSKSGLFTAASGDSSASPALQLLAQVREVHLLDAGLPSHGAYITDPAVAKALAMRQSSPRIIYHGTPRQWRDPGRTWLAHEKDRSVACLAAAGITIQEQEYLCNESPTLKTHFGVVDTCDFCLLGGFIGEDHARASTFLSHDENACDGMQKAI